MALVSGRGSTLNPNAPPFIPAVYRQVEDYSSEWWNLVQNSSGFRDHWLSEHQEGGFEGLSDSKKDDDITNLLPDTFDVGYDAEEFPNVEAEFEEMVNSFETYENRRWRTDFKAQHHHHHQHGLGLDAGAFMRSLNMYSPSSNRRGMTSLVEAAKYNERPVHQINLNHGPRRIHQPR